MNAFEFNRKRKELGVEGTGIDTVVTEERKWTHKTTKEVTWTIPKGDRVHVDFMPKKHPGRIAITHNGETKFSYTQLGYKWLQGFDKLPSRVELERQNNDGIVETPTGERVEPDGYGPDGSPSWLLILGLI